MICSDHPIPNTKNGELTNVKEGIHVFLPDLVCDRRKLIEIRKEAINMCWFFENACNDIEDIFDLAVYKVKFISYILS